MADGPIILFDAECFLCSANARFVLRHDSRKLFTLASIQGAAGAAIAGTHGLDPRDPTSLLVVDGTAVRRDSEAILFIYENLDWPWRMAAIFRLVPSSLRDPLYRWVARNRYRLFGKHATCWVAPPEYRSRILP
ncbi:thiol-disulfide oxidoreductase DCC family protein [Sphingopyxis sp. 550A]